MGNWWLAASSWQYTYSHISSLAEFFGEISNDPGDSATPPTAQIWHSVTSGFSKTKIIFEREEIADDWWDSEKYDRAADGDWENCVRSQGASFEGDWGIVVLCTMFLASCIFCNKCLFFHITWLDTFWTGLVYIYGNSTHLRESETPHTWGVQLQKGKLCICDILH